ncbi:MAG: hypothetical protein NZ561_07960, partial [Phycisphaerae bacterium]|nr:hypothetical protein [Phycisphaerae bacterium]
MNRLSRTGAGHPRIRPFHEHGPGPAASKPGSSRARGLERAPFHLFAFDGLEQCREIALAEAVGIPP